MRLFLSLLLCMLPLLSLREVSGQGESSSSAPEKLPTRYLPNVLRIHPNVLSGGMPEGEQAFRELAELGIRTIISVDGAMPDVKLAQNVGLRYVHLPHGYDGIPETRVRELAKAVKVLPGPIYIHCHHGKHRSPAAAAVACITAGLIEPARAEAILKTAGTSENYRGLHQSAREAVPVDPQILDETPAEFPERATIAPLAETMVAMERIHDRLQKAAANGWRAPSNDPDLDPAHESLLLREHFTETLRTDATRLQTRDFQQWLEIGESATQELEAAIRESRDPASAWAKVGRSCVGCHRQFRDVPLREKRK